MLLMVQFGAYARYFPRIARFIFNLTLEMVERRQLHMHTRNFIFLFSLSLPFFFAFFLGGDRPHRPPPPLATRLCVPFSWGPVGLNRALEALRLLLMLSCARLILGLIFTNSDTKWDTEEKKIDPPLLLESNLETFY